jgi:hypothetical protein
VSPVWSDFWSASDTGTPGGGMILILLPCWEAGRPGCEFGAGFCPKTATADIRKTTAIFMADHHIEQQSKDFVSTRVL